MDLKEQITKAFSQITKDEASREAFLKDPTTAVEQALGVDLPNETIDKVIEGVKAKLTVDKLAGAADALKGILGH